MKEKQKKRAGRKPKRMEEALREIRDLIAAGRLAEGEAAISALHSAAPDSPAVLRLQAILALEAKQYDRALALLQAVLQEDSGHPDDLHTLGCIYEGAGDPPAALRSYRQALEIEPSHRQTLRSLGDLLTANRFDHEAAISFEKALAADPGDYDLHLKLARSLHLLGDVKRAINLLETALTLRAENSGAHLLLGSIYHHGRMAKEALAHYEPLREILPDNPQLATLLAHLYTETSRHAEAIAWVDRLIDRGIITAELLNIRGYALLSRHDLVPALQDFVRAFQFDPSRWFSLSNLLLTLHYHDTIAPDELFAVHREFGALMEARCSGVTRRHGNDRSPGRRLRIGYVSADFRTHSVSSFFEPLIAHHDPDAFEVFCYSLVKNPDATTLRLKSLASRWRDFVRLTPQEMDRQISADQIDILVDLAGHTADGAVELFGLRPSPVQVTWLGYPDTTGLLTMDYRIVDSLTDPEGVSDAFATERLFRLPQGFLCFRPPASLPEVSPLPARHPGAVTFGCFNKMEKISPTVITLWSSLLLALPEARLLLKNKSLGDPGVQEGIRREFQNSGIRPEQLVLRGQNDDLFDHLSAYGEVDIALDTYPYHGTTTTFEALTMGVPVITLAGAVHAARVGVSILTHLSGEDLIAKDPRHYLEIAVSLARNLNLLSSIRSSLRSRLHTSSLADEAGFARRMETAFHTMWREWTQSATGRECVCTEEML